jgi:hypothetical protein
MAKETPHSHLFEAPIFGITGFCVDSKVRSRGGNVWIQVVRAVAYPGGNS